jgi:hypothetical protein
VLEGWVGTAGGNRLFYAATFQVSASVVQGWSFVETGPKTGEGYYVASVEATPLGGVAPFTYAWSTTNGSGALIADPSAAETALLDESGAATQLVCAVTDANGATGLSNTVTV